MLRPRGILFAGWLVACGGALALALASPADGEVLRFEEIERRPVADGKTFGDVGPYERLKGKLHFAIDPAEEGNRVITDLDLAPTDADGRVRFSAAVTVLRPSTPRPSSAVLLEVPNRGSKSLFSFFHRGAAHSNAPLTAEHLGDALLLRHGFTLVWVGWQQDLPYDPELLGMDRVEAVAEPPIRGLARAERVPVDPVRTLSLGHRGHQAYPAVDPLDPRHVLMVTPPGGERRQVVPRDRWHFARLDREGRVVADPRWVVAEESLAPGSVVELVYLAEEPLVVGLGLLAIRDAASFFKHEFDRSPGEEPTTQDPPTPRRLLAFGNSQGGRFLRQLLYLGLDRDVAGRSVLDGVWIHAAGAGRGSFNHRFAQPSRDGHPLSSIDFPTDLFPFAPVPQVEDERRDSLLARSRAAGGAPRLMITSSGYDYWGRGMSLVHTSVEGRNDLDLGADLRLYHFAASQHFVDRFPPAAVGTRFAGNPVDFHLATRALLLAFDRWLANGTPPPPSRYPKLADRTLIAPEALDFPGLRGIEPPQQPRRVYRLDMGPRFESEGIVDWQPPIRGAAYPVLVPQVDRLGNEIAGIRLPEVEVPVATTTGWNYRAEKIGAPGALADFRGAFLPLSRNREDRERRGDQRPSLEELYPDVETYRQRFRAAAQRLVDEGFLLAEDLPELERRAQALWDLVAGGAARLPLED